MKTTSEEEDKITSNIDIYKKDNNFEEDPDIEDNPGSANNKQESKTTPDTVDRIPSQTDIYLRETDYEDYLKCEDNFGCTINRKELDISRSQTPIQSEQKILDKFLELSKSKTMKEAPDLAIIRLTGKSLISNISNQHLAGKSWRPNDSQDQVETSYHPGCGSDSVSLT